MSTAKKFKTLCLQYSYLKMEDQKPKYIGSLSDKESTDSLELEDNPINGYNFE